MFVQATLNIEGSMFVKQCIRVSYNIYVIYFNKSPFYCSPVSKVFVYSMWDGI